MSKEKILFEDKEPSEWEYVCLFWEDGSECECIYNGLDKSILPLPTHWMPLPEPPKTKQDE